MTKVKLANVVLLLTLLLGSRAFAQEGIQFERSFFLGFGSAHINVGSDKFRVYESFNALVGSFGYWVSEMGGNRAFSPLGNIPSPNPIAARIVQLDDSTRTTINANTNLGMPQIDAGVLFDGTNASTSSLIATIWTMSNIEQYFTQLKAHYGTDYSEFGRDEFRFITAVLMTSKFQTTSNINFNTQLNFTVQLSQAANSPPANSPIPTVNATIGGSVDHQQAVTLLGNNVIGYQWNMVCWENGVPTTHILDDFQASASPKRPANCKSYSQ